MVLIFQKLTSHWNDSFCASAENSLNRGRIHALCWSIPPVQQCQMKIVITFLTFSNHVLNYLHAAFCFAICLLMIGRTYFMFKTPGTSKILKFLWCKLWTSVCYKLIWNVMRRVDSLHFFYDRLCWGLSQFYNFWVTWKIVYNQQKIFTL